MCDFDFSFDISKAIETVHYLVVAGAALAGGAWAYRRFRLERTAEAALCIELSARSVPAPQAPMHLVFLEATLRNVGKTQISARAHSDAKLAYSDADEKLAYSGTLEIRRLIAPTGNATHLDWFDSHAWATIDGLPPIDMLSDYENPDKNDAVEFWMEPNESYALARSVVLPAGVYLAKFTFLGPQEGDFWTRLLQFTVPGS